MLGFNTDTRCAKMISLFIDFETKNYLPLYFSEYSWHGKARRAGGKITQRCSALRACGNPHRLSPEFRLTLRKNSGDEQKRSVMVERMD